MRNTNRALAAAAVGALAALTLSTAPALAQPDAPNVPDPTTCSDALTSLVKVRTTENGLGARVTVLEQDDKTSAKALHMAQQADKEAQATRDAKIAAANSQYTNGKPYRGVIIPGQTPPDTQLKADQRADAAALLIRDQKIADANSEYQAGGTAAALVKAQHEYNRNHSALLDIRARLGGAHNDVARITVIVGKLCNQTPPATGGFKNCDDAIAAGVHDIPASDPRYRRDLDSDGDGIACEAPTAPIDTTTPAPSNNGTVIVNNPSIGQVPTGSNTGGGAEAANVE